MKPDEQSPLKLGDEAQLLVDSLTQKEYDGLMVLVADAREKHSAALDEFAAAAVKAFPRPLRGRAAKVLGSR